MKVRFAKFLFKLRENEIRFDLQTGAIFHEAFNHPDYRALSPERQRKIKHTWARELYQIEVNQPLDHAFPGFDLKAICEGGKLLDLGCYVGGKTVRWVEKYRGRHIYGLDVAPTYLEAAKMLAREKDLPADFSLGFAEQIPFKDGSFEVVLSVNTFEHVRDLNKSLSECRRVLKPGGHLVVRFPHFNYPLAHHLDLVTKTPGIHWLFSYETLLRAYFSILNERGESASWYRREEEHPLPFEKGYSINGITGRWFHRWIEKDWKIVYDGFRDSRATSSQNILKQMLDIFGKAIPLPVMRELYEAVYVLKKE